MNEINYNELKTDTLREIKDILESQEVLREQMQSLRQNKYVMDYIQTTEEYKSKQADLENLEKRLKNACRDNNHREILLFLGYEKDSYENSKDMILHCLNCGETFNILGGNIGDDYVIDIKEEFPSFWPLRWGVVADQLRKRYQSLQQCYLENPHILKETEKSKKMIYKAIKKECRNMKED